MKRLRLLGSVMVLGWGMCGLANADLTHLYTFDDGTANDSVGDADGTLMGDAVVSEGQVLLDGSSTTYVDLPGPAIAINTYPAITLELWLTSSPANMNYTMAAVFGRTFAGASDPLSQANGGPFANGDTWRGVHYLMLQPTRGDGHGRVAITAQSFEAESGISAPGQINDGKEHMMAVTVDGNNLTYYFDGSLIGTSPVGANTLAALSNDHAYLGRSVYPGDAYFVGSINQFGIWNNARSAEQIAVDFATARVPEPCFVSLIGLGLVGLGTLRTRRF